MNLLHLAMDLNEDWFDPSACSARGNYFKGLGLVAHVETTAQLAVSVQKHPMN